MDKKNDMFLIFCNECKWEEKITGLQYEFCPKCGHVNIGFKKITKQCKLLVYNSIKNENEWINGEVIGKQNSYSGEDFPYRYNVKVTDGIHEACHPDCIKIV